MGGKAFLSAHTPAGHTLNIQPLEKATYDRLKDIYLDRIRAHLGHEIHVEVLKEAPEKTSYGDIDYALSADGTIDFAALATAVGAVAVLKHGPLMSSLAVCHDGLKHDSDVAVYKKVNGWNLSLIHI